MTAVKGTGKAVVILLLAVTACSKKEEVREYSARVEKDFLYTSSLDSVLTTDRYKNLYREEYINRWIHDKLLYKEAVKNGILDDAEYKNIIANIKEEAAIALYVKRLNDEFDLSYNDEDLKSFYRDNADDFKCGDDAYVYNQISFVSYDKALKFRSTLLESGWDNTVKVFTGDPTIRGLEQNKFSYANEIQPDEIYKIVVNMQENDVSILTETEPGVFTIVQLVKSFPKDSVPDFEYIQNQVKERYVMQKRKYLLNEAVQKLYSKYDIEIKKDK